jgi:hypothetical protein
MEAQHEGPCCPACERQAAQGEGVRPEGFCCCRDHKILEGPW